MVGFIGQLMAINHPERVLSLTSIMSGPGGHDAVDPWAEGAAVLTRVPPETREGRIDHAVWIRSVLVGRGNSFDEAAEIRKSARAVDRSYYPVGTARQLVAVLAPRGRLSRLAKMKRPPLVARRIAIPL